MYWSFAVLVYANIGLVKMKIPCTLVVSLTVDRICIVFSTLFSTLGILVDLKKPQKITFSSFLKLIIKY